MRAMLAHPANRGQFVPTLARWIGLNVAKRVAPARTMRVAVGAGAIVGPLAHPVVNLAFYVSDGLYDADAMRGVLSLVDPGDQFVDVGANLGVYSVLAATRLGPTGSIVAFEPLPAERAWLSRNLAGVNSQVTIEPRALADVPGRLVLREAGRTMHHLVKDGDGGGDGPTVEVVTFDSAVPPVASGQSFAKIDVEGWDPAVIAGAERWLARRPRGLLVEANGASVGRCPVPWARAVDLINDAGLHFVWPDVAGRVLHRFDQPPAVSPFGDYFAVDSEGVDRLERLVRSGPV